MIAIFTLELYKLATSAHDNMTAIVSTVSRQYCLSINT